MKSTNEISALIVRQWLIDWDDVLFSNDPSQHREKPDPNFYIFSLPAPYLRRLSDVYRRKADRPRSEDLSIQRAHETERSDEIERFIHNGFPYSLLSERQKNTNDFKNLKMPGWLPTAIVANILPVGDSRGLKKSDSIRIEKTSDTTAKIILPENYLSDNWEPSVRPLEIIDGQHRLYAFEELDTFDGDFDLPVVAFNDLDFTWQAYLFYTINIKPKKINTSLAYDLYPLLRVQDWLEKSPDGLLVYRETRAQELTELLWSHPESPWHERINMLGEKRGGDVTQAAFIRSLLTSYVKRGKPIGGLFGDELYSNKGDVLQWNRAKQAAFLIFVWQNVEKAISDTSEPWAETIRKQTRTISQQSQSNQTASQAKDSAFASPISLLATDQGVRGVLQVTNDMCNVASDELKLKDWFLEGESEFSAMNHTAVKNALATLKKQPISQFLKSISKELSKFDWRTSSAEGLSESQRRAQMVFKGSSGYKELRLQLVEILCASNDKVVRETANSVKELLKY
jgi:DGQHR domain-containing protein